jgi:hypothetical protein
MSNNYLLFEIYLSYVDNNCCITSRNGRNNTVFQPAHATAKPLARTHCRRANLYLTFQPLESAVCVWPCGRGTCSYQ